MLSRSRDRRARPKKESERIPYADFRKVTKTGRLKTTKHDKNDCRFGIQNEVPGVGGISKSASRVYICLARIAD